MAQMPKLSFMSVPEVEVRPPPVKEITTKSSSRRGLRPLTKKRDAEQIAEEEEQEELEDMIREGSFDLKNLEEDPTYVEDKSSVQATKGQKRARKSASANTQVSLKKDQQERFRDLEKQKRDLERKVKALETSLKRVTTESVLNARKGTKEVWDHARIEAEFKTVKRDVKSWVKKYGTTKKISTFSDRAKKDILSACTTEHYADVFSEADFSTILELPKGAQLLLEGFLYAQSTGELINRPFLFIDAILQEHSRPNKAITAYGNNEDLFDLFAESLGGCKAFPDQTERWTASVLQSLKRLIIPEQSVDTASHLKDEKSSSDPYRIYELGISQLANEFLHHSKSVKHLLGDVEQKESRMRHEDLKKIYRKFRELAYHMWCQPSKVCYSYELHPFNPESMELDLTAVHGRQDMNADEMKDKMRGSKVLIYLCPMIWADIFKPMNGKERQRIVYLTQKVWTVDCQTFSQWKASQDKSPSSSGPVVVTKSASIDGQSVLDLQFQESKKDTDDTTSSPADTSSDMACDIPEAQEDQPPALDARDANFGEALDTNDALKHDGLDNMQCLT